MLNSKYSYTCKKNFRLVNGRVSVIFGQFNLPSSAVRFVCIVYRPDYDRPISGLVCVPASRGNGAFFSPIEHTVCPPSLVSHFVFSLLSVVFRNFSLSVDTSRAYTTL